MSRLTEDQFKTFKTLCTSRYNEYLSTIESDEHHMPFGQFCMLTLFEFYPEAHLEIIGKECDPNFGDNRLSMFWTCLYTPQEEEQCRPLAYVVNIDNIVPIEGADRIELAIIGGWQVVVKKGDFEVGKKAVYFEIDSFLPIREAFEFLRKSSFKTMTLNDGSTIDGFRLRTIKLRGELSQGLLLPTDIINENVETDLGIGFDVTTLLGVRKWSKPLSAQLNGIAKGGLPHGIPKTDESRIQNLKRSWESYASKEWMITEKLDGSSMTIAVTPDAEFHVCSRNYDLVREETNAFWNAAIKLNLEEELRRACHVMKTSIALQGELVGPGIQGNKYGLAETQFFAYKAWDIENKCYLDLDSMCNLVMMMGIEMVPILYTNYDFANKEAICELALTEASGITAIGTKEIQREGIVCYTHDGKYSFKAINNQFLLDNEDD